MKQIGQGEAKFILSVGFICMVVVFYWLVARRHANERATSFQEQQRYLLRSSHLYYLLSPAEWAEVQSSLEIDFKASHLKQNQLSDLQPREDFQLKRELYSIPEQSEWWGTRHLRSQSESVKLNVRPSDEFLEQLWLNDMNMQKSLKNLDIHRPPVKAEIVIPY